MRNARTAAIFLLPLMFACKPTPVLAPPKPPSVPASAVWAGGADGGAWIDCTAMSSKRRYKCSVWNDFGDPWIRSGDYLLGSAASLDFEAFNGEFFFVRGGRLDPDGWVRYPIDAVNEKRSFYRRGSVVLEDVPAKITDPALPEPTGK